MSLTDEHEILEQFAEVVRSRSTATAMAALIIDSPWLPGYAGLDTLDFYFEPRAWLQAYEQARRDLPGVVFVPDVWPEYGMAAEPSGWGLGIRWSHDAPPGLHAHPGGLDHLLGMEVPDPETDGLMPAILRHYERLGPDLARRGRSPRIAATRGPLAVAAHLVGPTEFLMSTQLDAGRCLELIERTTDLCIRWLGAQLARMTRPVAVLVLDDVVGLMSPEDAGRFAFPHLKRIFEAFPDRLHLFHNDTPNPAVYPGLGGCGIDLFNLTHEVSLAQARRLLGPRIVLMGNLAPLDLMVRGTPDQVRRETEALLSEFAALAPLVVSPGGGVSPATPVANLQAMAEVVAAHARP